MRLVLLPGMDGTGQLFSDFVTALPIEFQTEIATYPSDICLSESELGDFVGAAMPVGCPFVLLAESLSSPLAIRYAATNPPDLKGLVLCAGFASSAVRGPMRVLGSLLAPLLARVALPDFAMRTFLIGPNAPRDMSANVRLSVSTVNSAVMASRMRLVLACDVTRELGDVVAPILYVQAKRDRLVREACMKEVVRIKPDADVRVIDGPHLILQREPQRSAEIVAEFVRRAR